MENRAEKSGIAAETHAKVRLEIYSDDKMMNHSLTISIIIIFFFTYLFYSTINVENLNWMLRKNFILFFFCFHKSHKCFEGHCHWVCVSIETTMLLYDHCCRCVYDVHSISMNIIFFKSLGECLPDVQRLIIDHCSEAVFNDYLKNWLFSSSVYLRYSNKCNLYVKIH